MKLGPYNLGYTTDDHAGIYEGDARELARAVPDESVDLIFTTRCMTASTITAGWRRRRRGC